MQSITLSIVLFLAICRAEKGTTEPSYENCLTVDERLKCEQIAIRRVSFFSYTHFFTEVNEALGVFSDEIVRLPHHDCDEDLRIDSNNS